MSVLNQPTGIYLNFIQAVDCGKRFRQVSNPNWILRVAGAGTHIEKLETVFEETGEEIWAPIGSDIRILASSKYVIIEPEKKLTADILEAVYNGMIYKNGEPPDKDHLDRMLKGLGLK